MQGVLRLSPAARSAGAETAAAVLALAACACALAASPALAQQRGNVQAEQSRSIGERVFSRGLPAIGRYVSVSGDSFILDRSGPRPLIRFDRRPETFTLRAQAAPRGDVVYRNDAGEIVLRITREGGLTLYTEAAPAGSPVFSFGEGQALTPPLVTAAQLWRHLLNQSVLAGRALQRSVFLLAPDISQGSETVVADAATVAVEALIRMSRSDSLRAQAARVRRIEIVEGRRPDAAFADGTLRITVQPSAGPGGRPSSTQVIRAVSGR